MGLKKEEGDELTDEDVTVGTKALAKIMQISRSTLYTRICRSPETVPPHCEIEGSSKKVWLRKDVEEWLRVRRQTRSKRGS